MWSEACADTAAWARQATVGAAAFHLGQNKLQGPGVWPAGQLGLLLVKLCALPQELSARRGSVPEMSWVGCGAFGGAHTLLPGEK